MIRVIIIAAGKETRWNKYKGISKHFIEIDGEPIIKRTVRLAKQYTDDIYVVGKDKRYNIPDSKLFIPKFNKYNYDADKFLNSEELWNTEGRTVVLYGDVYFTDQAMKSIMEYEGREWKLFGRFEKSDITGTPYGECFAQSFYPEDIKKHKLALLYIADLKSRNKIIRCGGWEHYRVMSNNGEYGPRVKKDEYFFEIDDWTDDFDSPQDYEVWLSRYKKHK